MKKINLILDDLRDEQMCFNASGNKDFLIKKWIIVRTFDDFKKFIINRMPDLIAFDHDLADFDKNGDEYTGKDAANWLINHCLDNDLKLPNFIVHSSNTVGNKNILSLLSQFKEFQNL